MGKVKFDPVGFVVDEARANHRAIANVFNDGELLPSTQVRGYVI